MISPIRLSVYPSLLLLDEICSEYVKRLLNSSESYFGYKKINICLHNVHAHGIENVLSFSVGASILGVFAYFDVAK